MGDSAAGRWSWQLPGFEKRKSFEMCDDEDVENDWGKAVLPTSYSKSPPLDRRYSISTMVPQAEVSRHRMTNLSAKVQKLKDRVSITQEDCLELRQQVSDLQEYSNVKISRVSRYLGVLAEKASKLDLITLETEARLAPLIKERKKLFNDLIAVKGNIRVFCRVRPQFEHEGSSAIEFPDDFTIRVSSGGDSLNDNKKDFEFDRVHGPHVGQGDFFQEIQPLVQSALDGYNVSLFAYGQTGSGKTHTMEGPSHDRGLYFRVFEELFDLSNADSISTSTFTFHVTMLELHNEKIYDLLYSCNGSGTSTTVQVGPAGSSVELVKEKVENPTDFARVLKMGFQKRGLEHNSADRCNHSHLMVTIHINYSNSLAGEDLYSKLSLVDMAGSDRLTTEEASGERLTELLHVNKSLSAVGDVLSALTAKKEYIPYTNSRLTQILSDSLGFDSKTLIIVHITPSYADVQETISSLSFAARVRNIELSLGNRDTIKKWRDVANEARKELYEKEKEVSELSLEVMGLKKALKDADDQCLLLFGEVQKAWKVAFTLQTDLKTESVLLAERQRFEKEQNVQLRNQVAQLLKVEEDQKVQLEERTAKIHFLQAKVQELEQNLSDVKTFKDREVVGFHANLASAKDPDTNVHKLREDNGETFAVTARLEQELLKRDELIKRLHEENEKLFERLTDRSVSESSPKVSRLASGGMESCQSDCSVRNKGANTNSPDQLNSGVGPATQTVSLIKSDSEKVKSTPAGEYLTAALLDFNPDQYDSPAAIADGANKLLMLVLAAVIKAGAAREHEMLAEIRDPVFAFIHKLEALRVMDAMLVSRVRILYIRSLLSRSPELQSVKALPVECFLVKAAGRSRSSSRGSSPGRSPFRHESNARKDLMADNIQGFRVNIKQEKKSKFSSIVLKLRGIDQETWQQHITGGKLREMTDDARNYAMGNKDLAALFVHTPAGDLQRQIRAWLAENFDFLSVTGGDSLGGVPGQLELLSTAIMDGWMSGLGVPQHPSTDALGQLLSAYTKQVYTAQLQHLKDVAGTLATEDAEDLPQITKLRSALESIDHKRRKLLQKMRTDVAILTKEGGGSPVRNPSTSAEDSRLASLISLEEILKQVEEIQKEASCKVVFAVRKEAMFRILDELSERMPSLLSIDHPCVQRHLANARKLVESLEEKMGQVPSSSMDGSLGAGNDVVQWSVLQFNTGSTTPFVIKCGATSNSELVVKAHTKSQDKNGKEIVTVVPKPSVLTNMDFTEMKHVISQLPESLCQLALARTADGTRARYYRLYKTLAMRVPSMKTTLTELEKEEPSRDGLNPSTPSNRPAQLRRKSDSDNLSDVTR